MSQTQTILYDWFSRPVKSGSTNFFVDLPFTLATDTGLVRKQNQDKAGAVWLNNNQQRIFALAISDGMGGMKDGAECASLTISVFMSTLIENPTLALDKLALLAVQEANEAVVQFAQEKGGATLSALLFGEGFSPVLVHVGDSRIYTYGSSKRLNRQTTDDSMAEALGGAGRELLQFVGMGESINPKVDYLDCSDDKCLITTDGIHRLDEKVIGEILNTATDMKQASERLMILARWCGGKDNATSAILNISEIKKNFHSFQNSGTRIWDPFGELTLQIINKHSNSSNSVSTDSNQQRDLERSPSTPNNPKKSRRVPKKNSNEKSKRNSTPKGKDLQLKIHMDESKSDDDDTDDRE